MQMFPIFSSRIQSYGFEANRADKTVGTLALKFTSGPTFYYFGVPLRVMEDFLLSGSKGRFFENMIRHAYAWKAENEYLQGEE